MSELLTEAERDVMRMTGQLAGAVHRMIGDGPQSANDWAEAAYHIHNIQHMVMAQAAARAYPGEYRLLGENIG